MVGLFRIKNRPKNRTRLEIVRDLLQAGSEKSRKTRIMYRVNLSYHLMQKYLGRILESGLMECVDESFYVITQRGKEFLQMYNDYLERCRKVGQEITETREELLMLEAICFSNEDNSK
ncbi:MAG: hypothetical protein JSV57_01260 [Candidatus Bathyarchaeota archaeon]|nr:MAG: hypothetical protein JSV57_01260 [Candidatus Bathyarchaeota archaeon]